MLKTHIVRIPVYNGNRGTLEDIENQEFDSMEHVRRAIHKEDKIPLDEIQIWSMSDYMDEANDSNIDQYNAHWLGYVQIKSSAKYHYVTTYSLIKRSYFGKLMGNDYHSIQTFKMLENGSLVDEGLHFVDVDKCSDVRQYIEDMYKEFAISHIIKELK